MLSFNEYLRIVIGLFALIGPFSTLPLFLHFTDNMPSQRQRIAKVTATAVACILVLSVIAGNQILALFGISINSFRVAGGILLMLIALGMLEAKPRRTVTSPEETQEAVDSDSVAIVPLALPMIAGPGSISTLIVFSSLSASLVHKLLLSAICIMMAVMIWACLHLAPTLVKHLSQTSLNVTSRVMGLILAAMAVEFIVVGVRTLLPGLAG